MIDLHSHTTESDGTFTPEELVAEGVRIGLEALGITDHDTFAGYDTALPFAQKAGLELVCGIELSTRLSNTGKPRGRSVHLLGYFLGNGHTAGTRSHGTGSLAPATHEPPASGPSASFRVWLHELQASRRDRNVRMAERLRSLGVDVQLEDVEALGRSIAGRPHFARLMVEKGYVRTHQEAFDKFLDESAKAYVPREEPSTPDAIARVLDAGGLPSLAHPLRLGLRPDVEERALAELVDAGLPAIEVWHSDHGPSSVARYGSLARRLDLIPTGGSDFHGAHKPKVRLGTGLRGNLAVPREALERMKQFARRSPPR